MSANKQIVEEYMQAFALGDHGRVLATLTDDIEWEVPGFYQLIGKEAFQKEMQNDAFVGLPVITVDRLTEENDIVVAEGSVRTELKDGGPLYLKYCDVFEMKSGKIKKLISYLATIKT
jgi:ketosteroid isomerase-like protein